MMKYLISIFALIIIGCQKTNRENDLPNLKKIDKITFYRISEERERKFWDDNGDPKDDRRLDTLLLFNKKAKDSVLINTLNKNYQKFNVDSESFSKILQIFTEVGIPMNKASFLPSSTCAPVYRDILVFESQNEIICIAKICFGCGNYIWIKNDYYEHMQIDYEDLKLILDKSASR